MCALADLQLLVFECKCKLEIRMQIFKASRTSPLIEYLLEKGDKIFTPSFINSFYSGKVV